MRRLFVLAIAVAMLMTVAVGIATATPPDKVAKVEVCHVTGASDITFGMKFRDSTFAWGNIIEVSVKAVAAHLAHGDRVDFYTEAHKKGWDALHWQANEDGLTIHKRVDCWFGVDPVQPLPLP